ncbi:MAG TPA: TetR/AcrR family transcriptional regulator [Solirubrobacteraceae bacterium]|jgi:AcrR family transcriptional regulator
MPRPKQRTPELHDRVLSVAVELLARDGVAGFTTRSVAREAETSTPAVYELFGDKAGLVREVFFQGFRLLRRQLQELADSPDPREDLLRIVAIYRGFVRENPTLAQVMFSRPFSDFDPSRSEEQASGSVRSFIVEHVRRCTDVGLLHGEATDIAHVLVALAQGLVAAENSGRLGTTQESIDRRWELAVNAVLDGLSCCPTPERAATVERHPDR